MKIKSFLSLMMYAILSYSQSCFETPIELNKKVQNSKFIVDANVIAHEFAKDLQQREYIVYSLEIWKIWKGNITADTILLTHEIKALSNNLDYQNDIPSFSLGSKGVFFLNANNLQFSGKYKDKKAFSLYGHSQGAILFEKKSGKFQTSFKKEYNSYSELSSVLSAQITTPSIVKKNLSFNDFKTFSILAAGGPVITSIFPANIPAGIDSILEIRGSGFGLDTGINKINSYVEFELSTTNSQTRGRALLDDYILWSDTLIKVQVPSVTVNAPTDITKTATAGTGRVSVHVASLFATSAQTLVIPFSVFNAITGFDSDVIKKKNFRIRLFNKNNAGGYSFLFNNNFTLEQKQSFLKALNSWKCQTGVNWVASATTTSADTVGNDGLNVVSFQTISSAGLGSMGGLELCPDNVSTGKVFANELDILFSNTELFNFGVNFPSPNQSDFYTVALHELGHTLGINHVNQAEDLMATTVSFGTIKRVLSADNLNAANSNLEQAASLHLLCPAKLPMALTTSSLPLTVTIERIDSINVCGNYRFNYKANITNAQGAPTFLWSKNNINIPGAVTASPEINGINQGDIITCTVTEADGCARAAISNKLTEHFIPVPFTVSIVKTDSINVCGSYKFKFKATVANAQGPLSFIWAKNAVIVPGIIDSIEISGIKQGDIILCQVTQSGVCSTTIQSNLIAVNFVPLPPMSVTIERTDSINVCGSYKFKFKATVVNAQGTPTFIWRKNGIILPGVTGDSPEISDITQGQKITCVITESGCSRRDTSNEIIVNFVPLPLLSLNITSTQEQFPACPGPVEFNATVNNGFEPFKYQWKRGTVNVGIDSPNLVLENQQTGNITCIVTENGTCTRTATSNSIAVSYKPALVATISSNPSMPVCPDNLVIFKVTSIPISGDTIYTYKWLRGNTLIPNETDTELRLTNLQSGEIIKCVQTEQNNCQRTDTTNGIVVQFISPPAVPAAIVGSKINVCNKIRTYSISKVSGLKYEWSVPTGATIIGYNPVNMINNPQNSVRIQFSNDFTEGDISVVAKKKCPSPSVSSATTYLTSSARTIHVKGIPGKPVIKFKQLNNSLGTRKIKATVLQVVSPMLAIPDETFRWVIIGGTFDTSELQASEFEVVDERTIITKITSIKFNVPFPLSTRKFSLCVSKINTCGEGAKECYSKSRIGVR